MPNPTLIQAVLALISAFICAEGKRLESQQDVLLIPSGETYVELSEGEISNVI
jgi:hypothetical protein